MTGVVLDILRILAGAVLGPDGDLALLALHDAGDGPAVAAGHAGALARGVEGERHPRVDGNGHTGKAVSHRRAEHGGDGVEGRRTVEHEDLRIPVRAER